MKIVLCLLASILISPVFGEAFASSGPAPVRLETYKEQQQMYLNGKPVPGLNGRPLMKSHTMLRIVALDSITISQIVLNKQACKIINTSTRPRGLKMGQSLTYRTDCGELIHAKMLINNVQYEFGL